MERSLIAPAIPAKSGTLCDPTSASGVKLTLAIFSTALAMNKGAQNISNLAASHGVKPLENPLTVIVWSNIIWGMEAMHDFISL